MCYMESTMNMVHVLMTTISVLAGCTTEPSKALHFDTPHEAVKACTQWWKSIEHIKEDCRMEQVAELTNQWIELKDSAYSCLYKDSTAINDEEIIRHFHIVNDSIRDKLIRMATSRPRTLQEAIFLKIQTNPDKKRLRQSQEYTEAALFFTKLDDRKSDFSGSVEQYIKLLQTTTDFQDTDNVLEFLEKEDVCFRSLMTHLPDVGSKQMKVITGRTERVFNHLRLMLQGTDENTQRRMNVFLIMRANRRILQNAIACKTDIENGIELKRQEVICYKWMIIQPFLAIGDDALTYLTEKQETELMNLASEIEPLFNQLSGRDNETLNKLSQILADYYIIPYMNTII